MNRGVPETDFPMLRQWTVANQLCIQAKPTLSVQHPEQQTSTYSTKSTVELSVQRSRPSDAAGLQPEALDPESHAGLDRPTLYSVGYPLCQLPVLGVRLADASCHCAQFRS